MGHMHANLVGTARLQLHAHMGVMVETAHQTVVSDRFLTAIFVNRHLLALPRMAANRRLHSAAACHCALNYRFIFAADGALLQLGNQIGLGLQRLRHHHKTRSIFVEPMHNTGARNLNQLGAVV